METSFSKETLENFSNQFLNSSANPSKKKLSDEEWEKGKRFTTSKGLKVRSKIEKIIAEFYHRLGITIEYEKEIKFPKIQNPTEKYTFFCDFYLPDYDIYHEHFGLDDPEYQKLSKLKKLSFDRFKLKFFHTTVQDEENIEEAIIRKLKKFGIEIT